MNTDTCGSGNFESGQKSLRIQKYNLKSRPLIWTLEGKTKVTITGTSVITEVTKRRTSTVPLYRSYLQLLEVNMLEGQLRNRVEMKSK